MREIKFRAWDTRDKIYTENALPVPNGIEYHCPYDGHVLLPINERYVFEQFTGLRDKNGKEIYEGDIVRISDHLGRDFIYTVEWDQCGFVVNDVKNDRAMDCYMGNAMTIVGNIHENPELLA